MGFSLLARASIPLQFWFYAFVHAVYLTNRLPTPVLGHYSPYEVLYKVKPDYSSLKVFGCSCFPDLRPFQRYKLSFRSQQCVFLGMVPHTKGYRCLAADGRMFLSRHVKFDESKLPYHDGFSKEFPEIRENRCTSVLPLVTPNTGVITSAQPLLRSNRHTSLGTVSAQSRLNQPSASTSADSTTGGSSDQLISHQPSLSTSVDPVTIVEESTVGVQAEQTVATSSTTVPSNYHPMQTRSKSGIFRPKVFSSVLDETEPSTITETFQSPAWTATANDKYSALLVNHAWDLVSLPAGRRAVGCKWIFRIKRHADGTIARYKGGLVVKGYLQEARVDFQETFSPVVKPTSIRVVIALAVSLNWPLQQVDINNAFLNGDLSGDIYMVQPPGLNKVAQMVNFWSVS